MDSSTPQQRRHRLDTGRGTRRAPRRRHRGLAGLVLGIAVLAGVLGLSRAADAVEGAEVVLVGTQDFVPAGATILALSDSTTLQSDIQPGGTYYLRVPGVPFMPAATLTSVEVTRDADDDVAFLEGDSTMRGFAIDTLAIVDFPAGGQGEGADPTVAIAMHADLWDTRSVSNSWFLPGSSVGVQLRDFTFAASTGPLDVRDLGTQGGGFGGVAAEYLASAVIPRTMALPSGVTLGGGVDFGALVPGLVDQGGVATVRTQLDGDFSAAGDVTRATGSLRLRADIDTASLNLPPGVDVGGGWYLQLDAVSDPDAGNKPFTLSGGGSLSIGDPQGEASFEGTVDLRLDDLGGDDPTVVLSGDGGLRFGSLEASMQATVTIPSGPAGGPPTVTLGARNIPLGAGGLQLSELTSTITGGSFGLDFTVSGTATLGDLGQLMGAAVPDAIAATRLPRNGTGSLTLEGDDIVVQATVRLGSESAPAVLSLTLAKVDGVVVATMDSSGMRLGTLIEGLGAPAADFTLPDLVVVVASGAVPELPDALPDLEAPLVETLANATGPGVYLSARMDADDLPQGVRDALAGIGVRSTSTVSLTGTLPLFVEGNPSMELTLTLGNFGAEDLPSSINSVVKGLNVQVTMSAAKQGAGFRVTFGLSGDVTLAIPEVAELGGDPHVSDEVTFELAAEIAAGTGGASVSIGGSIVGGWETPLGIDWLDIDQLRLQMTASGGSSANLGIGIRAAATLTTDSVTKSFDLSFAVAVSSNLVDAGVRFASPEGFGLGDIVDVANDALGLDVDFGGLGLPDVQLRNLEFMASSISAPDLCLDKGFIIAADLYLEDRANRVPASVDYRPRANRVLRSDAGDGCRGVFDAPEVDSCGPDPDCKARIRFAVTQSEGLLVDAQLKAIDFGDLVRIEDTKLYLRIGSGPPAFELSGGISIVGAGTVQGLIRLSGQKFSFSVEVTGDQHSDDVFRVNGEADFRDPGFALEVFIRNKQLLGAASAFVNGVTGIYNTFSGDDVDNIYLTCFGFQVSAGVGPDGIYGGFGFDVHYNIGSRTGPAKVTSLDWDLSQSFASNVEGLASLGTSNVDTTGCGKVPDLVLEEANTDGTSKQPTALANLAGAGNDEDELFARVGRAAEWRYITVAPDDGSDVNQVGFELSIVDTDATYYDVETDWGDGTIEHVGACDSRGIVRGVCSQEPTLHIYAEAGDYVVTTRMYSRNGPDGERGAVLAERTFTALVHEYAEVRGIYTTSDTLDPARRLLPPGTQLEPRSQSQAIDPDRIRIGFGGTAPQGSTFYVSLYVDDADVPHYTAIRHGGGLVNSSTTFPDPVAAPMPTISGLSSGEHELRVELEYENAQAGHARRLLDSATYGVEITNEPPELTVEVAPNGTPVDAEEGFVDVADLPGVRFKDTQRPIIRLSIEDEYRDAPERAYTYSLEAVGGGGPSYYEYEDPSAPTFVFQNDFPRQGPNDYVLTVYEEDGTLVRREFTVNISPPNDLWSDAPFINDPTSFVGSYGHDNFYASYDLFVRGNQAEGTGGQLLTPGQRSCDIGTTWVKVHLPGDAGQTYRLTNRGVQAGNAIAGPNGLEHPAQDVRLNIFTVAGDGSVGSLVPSTRTVVQGGALTRLVRTDFSTPGDAVFAEIVPADPTGGGSDCAAMEAARGYVYTSFTADPPVNDDFADADQDAITLDRIEEVPDPVIANQLNPQLLEVSTRRSSDDLVAPFEDPALNRSVWMAWDIGEPGSPAPDDRYGRYLVTIYATNDFAMTINRGDDPATSVTHQVVRPTYVQPLEETGPNQPPIRIAQTVVDFRNASTVDPYVVGFLTGGEGDLGVYFQRMPPDNDYPLHLETSEEQPYSIRTLVTGVSPGGFVHDASDIVLGSGFATRDAGEPSDVVLNGGAAATYDDGSTWWSWRAPRDGAFRFDTAGSVSWHRPTPGQNMQSVVSVFREDVGRGGVFNGDYGSLTFLKSSASGPFGALELDAVGGELYSFRVAARTPGDGGEVHVRISPLTQVPDNAPPVVAPDEVETTSGTPVSLDLTDAVTDPDDELFLVDVEDPSVPGGDLDCDVRGACSFTPDPGFEGTATFTFTVSDKEVDETGTLAVDVGDRVAATKARPDVVIGIKGAGKPKGDDVYGSAKKQKATAKVKRGTKAVVVVELQNDGDTADRIRYTIDGKAKGFKVKGKGLSATTKRLAPGASQTLKVKVKLTKKATKKLALSVVATSTTDAKKKDKAVAILKARR